MALLILSMEDGSPAGFEPAFTSRFPALITYGLGSWVRVTLDLLLTAGQAGKSKALSRPAGLRYPPICIDRCAIDEFGTEGPVCIYEAEFPVDYSLIYHMRAEGLIA